MKNLILFTLVSTATISCPMEAPAFEQCQTALAEGKCFLPESNHITSIMSREGGVELMRKIANQDRLWPKYRMAVLSLLTGLIRDHSDADPDDIAYTARALDIFLSAAERRLDAQLVNETTLSPIVPGIILGEGDGILKASVETHNIPCMHIALAHRADINTTWHTHSGSRLYSPMLYARQHFGDQSEMCALLRLHGGE